MPPVLKRSSPSTEQAKRVEAVKKELANKAESTKSAKRAEGALAARKAEEANLRELKNTEERMMRLTVFGDSIMGKNPGVKGGVGPSR